VEELISDFEKILKMSEPSTSQAGANKRLHMNPPQEHTDHNVVTNNTMLIKPIVNFDLNPLKEIKNLRSHLSHKVKTVEDYQIEIIDLSIKCDTSYEIIKSVREYKGEEDKDKRPNHIFEQELSVLSQGSQCIES